MNRTKLNVCVNLQSCGVLFIVYTCAIWIVCVLFLYVGTASTPLFTAFVYSQIMLFKVRSAKRVWRINAHFWPYVFRSPRDVVWVGQGAEASCRLWAQPTPHPPNIPSRP